MLKKTDPVMSEGTLLRLILSSNANTSLAKKLRAAAAKQANHA